MYIIKLNLTKCKNYLIGIEFSVKFFIIKNYVKILIKKFVYRKKDEILRINRVPSSSTVLFQT